MKFNWVFGSIFLILIAVSFGVSAENVTDVVNDTVNETAENVTVENVTEVDVVVPDSESVEVVTTDALTEFVAQAKDYALRSGKDIAIAGFNDRLSKWAAPDMAIFAYDNDCKLLASPLDLNRVGQNQLSLSDVNGVHYVELMRNAAKVGGGFVTWTATDTIDGELVAKEMTAYVMPVDGNWWIGSEIFTPVVEKEICVISNLTENATPSV